MKVCVWGGPWDGRVVDIARPGRPIHVMKDPPVHAWEPDPSPRTPALEIVTYDVKQFYSPHIARPAGDEGPWFILVPSGAGDDELQWLQERYCTPVVDGPRDPISFADVFVAQTLAGAVDEALDEWLPHHEDDWEWGPDTARWRPQ